MHKLFMTDRMCKWLMTVCHHSIISRYLIQKVKLTRKLWRWRWKHYLDVFCTYMYLSMKVHIVKLNIPCLIPCNLDSKFTSLYMKIYKWEKKIKILRITLIPEHQLKIMALKVRAFIFHTSMRHDKYYVSNSLRH